MNEKELLPFDQWPLRVPNIAKAVASAEEITAALKSASSGEEALKAVKKFFRESDKVGEKVQVIEVRYTCNTEDKKLKKIVDALDEGLPLLQNATVAFQKAVLESPHRPYLEKKLGSH